MTQDEVKHLFNYRDGRLYWKEDRYSNKVKDTHAGTVDAAGYRVVNINKKFYKEHQLVYLYFHGLIPKIIDHKNRNKLDNRIENLREATAALNAQNRTTHKNNICGHKNVTYNQKRNCFYVRIMVDYVSKFIGTFKTLEEAIDASNKAREKYHVNK